MKWFDETKINNLDELRKEYKRLLIRYHPDNTTGDEEITKQIIAEYDLLFEILRVQNKDRYNSNTKEEKAENKAFKEVLEKIIHINAEIEIVGVWLWVSNGYLYKELLKSLGFKYAPKKKMWCWHFGDYKRVHKSEIPIDVIREKYGSEKISKYCNQYSLN